MFCVGKKWYGKRTKYQRLLIYFICFSIAFAITWLAANAVLLFEGKSLIVRDDSIATYYEMLMHRKQVVLEIIQNIFEEGRFSIPWINYNLTGNSNLFCIIGYEIFDIVSWLVPKEYFEVFYCIVIVLRLWLVGIAFSLYCMRRGHRKKYILLGALVYTFCGYAMFYGNVQPLFMSMLYMVPIMFIGVEDIFEHQNGKLFSIMVFLSWINCIFTTYYNTIAIGLYVLFRCVENHQEIRKIIKVLLKIGINYFIGFGIGCFIFIPEIFIILSSGRMKSGMYLPLTYGISFFLDMIKHFFILVNATYNSYMGFSAVVLFPLIYLILVSRKNKVYKIALFVLFILMNLPVFGLIAGAGIINNRWSYLLSFLVAYIVVLITPKLLIDLTRIKRQQINLLGALYVFVIIMTYLKNKTASLAAEILLLLLMIFCMNVIWKINKRSISYILLLGMIVISVAVNGISIYGSHFNDRAQSYINVGYVNEELSQYADAAAQEIEDDSFFRVDKSEFTDELSCNLPLWFGYNGVSSFSNVLNSSSMDYFREMENTGMMQGNKYADLGGKVTDEALACIKYYLTDNEQSENIPYGFEWQKDYSQNEQYAIYENKYALPLGFTYQGAISINEFQTLSIAEKQEILLKKVLLEESFVEESKSGLTELESKELELEIVDSNNIEKTKDGWHVIGKDAYLTVVIDAQEESELYLQLTGIENRSKSNCRIIVSNSQKEESAYSHGIASERSNGQKSFAFNMGCAPQGKAEVKISFAQYRDIYIGNIQAHARDLKSYADDIAQLTEECLENIHFETNKIEGDIEVKQDKYLCISIPYSRGWACYVDGEKTEILKGNIMYMVVPLEGGAHHIELEYIPEGMRLGIMISFITLLGMISFASYKRIRNK